MPLFATYIAKALILPTLVGGFCLGMFLHAASAQAMTIEHAAMGTDAGVVHVSDPGSMGSECCAMTHTEHEVDAVAPDAGKIAGNAYAVPADPVFFHDQLFFTDPMRFAFRGEYPTRASRLTGTIMKRE